MGTILRGSYSSEYFPEARNLEPHENCCSEYSPEEKNLDPPENCSNISIPDDLLIDILSFVPVKDLLENCRVVSRQWKDTVDSCSLWKLKCDRKNIKVPSRETDTSSPYIYQIAYFCNKYGKNLLKNPCGVENMKYWVVTSNGGDGFIVENPPSGTDPVPAVVGFQSCFVTSYNDCEKQQNVDLYRNKIVKRLVRSGLIKIKVGDWTAAHGDCGSRYRLEVMLLNENKCEIDNFFIENVEERVNPRVWDKIAHTFENVADARYVVFKHFGKDRKYWAGPYGAKLTGSYIKLCFE